MIAAGAPPGRHSIDVYRRLRVVTIFGHVSAVSTTRRSQRLRGHLGVGTGLPRLRRALPRLRCFRLRRHLRRSQVGGARAGARVTAFDVRRKRVRRVTVGRVVD